MSIRRLVAIIIIYLIACMGWLVLGTATSLRSQTASGSLRGAVAEHWGGPLEQAPPTLEILDEVDHVIGRSQPVATDIKVTVASQPRQKGLIWYPTFACSSDIRWTIANTTPEPQRLRLRIPFPAAEATYEDFALLRDGEPIIQEVDTRHGLRQEFTLAPGDRHEIAFLYRTRGLGHWSYLAGSRQGRIRNLSVNVHTNFANVDWLDGGLSAMTMSDHESGKDLRWQADDLITRQDLGVVIPTRLNPGPLTSRITFFAPVCLGFFFLLIGTITVVARIPIHPMHYLFVAGGFFAFHLLLAYLVDHMSLSLAFAMCAAVSMGLTTSYLRSALGAAFPVAAALAGQGFFLVLFSYSFFFSGLTGLTVAVGSVVTLAVLMRVTAKLDWQEVFAHTAKPSNKPPKPPRSNSKTGGSNGGAVVEGAAWDGW